MRTMFALSLACLGCRTATPEPPEPVDDRPWCDREGHDWAVPSEPEPIREPEPAAAVLGFASIDKELIVRPIREHMWAIEACYDFSLIRDPNVRGRLSVRFEIDADGRVSEIEVVDDELPDPCLGRCVIAVGKKYWSWPPPASGGTITITYPFLFSR